MADGPAHARRAEFREALENVIAEYIDVVTPSGHQARALERGELWDEDDGDAGDAADHDWFVVGWALVMELMPVTDDGDLVSFSVWETRKSQVGALTRGMASNLFDAH